MSTDDRIEHAARACGSPLTAAELHARYGVHRRTLDRWREVGKIEPVSGKRQNNRNPLRYDPADVEVLLREHIAAFRKRLDRLQQVVS